MRVSASSSSLSLCALSLLVFLCTLPAFTSAFYTSKDDVVELTTSNFAKEVLKSDDAYLVEFYAPWCGHCKALTPEYKKAAKSLKGVAKVGAVDMTKYESFGAQYGIKGFPTIKLFIGSNKNAPVDYQGERTASAMADFVKREVKAHAATKGSGGGGDSGSSKGSKSGSKSDSGAKVVDLTESTFDELVLKSDDLWLVEFFAPWCGHCKNLAPHWAQAASELGGIAKLGAVDATVYTALASKYDVKGYPTIKVFTPGKKAKADDYNGGRTASDIVQYAKNLAETVVPPKAKEVVQLTSQAVWDDTCAEHTCLVSFLPHILDSQAKGRNAYLATLKAVAAANAKKPFTFLWSEIGAQPGVEEALTGTFGGIAFPPAVVAVNLKKERVVMMTGAFTEDGISKFVGGIVSGAEKPVKLDRAPKVDKADKWDGKDAKPPVEEKDDEL